jgi:hypothetical protein
MYNEEIGNLMYIIKLYPKFLFITAHNEWISTDNGIVGERIMVQGNVWKGMIESQFTIVHFSNVQMKENNKRSYILELQSDGKTSAKTPPMFLSSEEQDTMENDYAIFLGVMKKKLNE